MGAHAPSVGQRAAQSLRQQMEQLATAGTDALYRAHPELLERYGEEGRQKCLQDFRYNLEHLAPAVSLSQPELFARYAVWLVGLLEARNVPARDVRRSFDALQRVIDEHLDEPEAAEARASLRAGMDAVDQGSVA